MSTDQELALSQVLNALINKLEQTNTNLMDEDAVVLISASLAFLQKVARVYKIPEFDIDNKDFQELLLKVVYTYQS